MAEVPPPELKTVKLCLPRLAHDMYDDWLNLTDSQVEIFKTLERRARVMPTERRLQVLKPSGFSVYCVYCREAVATVVDHKKAIADLGDSRIENLAAACGDCNARKGAKRRFKAPAYSNTEELLLVDTRPVFWLNQNTQSMRFWDEYGDYDYDPQNFVLASDGR